MLREKEVLRDPGVLGSISHQAPHWDVTGLHSARCFVFAKIPPNREAHAQGGPCQEAIP